MTLLSREAILKADDYQVVDVEVPEWGGTVRLRSITAAERDRFEQSLLVQRGNKREVNMRNARAKLVVLCAVDDKGNKLFTDEDIKILSAKSAKPLDKLFEEAQKLSGLSESDVEELTEDLDETLSDSSLTD